MSKHDSPAVLAGRDRYLAASAARLDALVAVARQHTHRPGDPCPRGCLGDYAAEMLKGVSAPDRLVMLMFAISDLANRPADPPEWGVRWPGEHQIVVFADEISAIAEAGAGRDGVRGVVMRRHWDGTWYEVDYPDPRPQRSDDEPDRGESDA